MGQKGQKRNYLFNENLASAKGKRDEAVGGTGDIREEKSGVTHKHIRET